MNRRQLAQLVLGLPFVNLLTPKKVVKPYERLGYFDGRVTSYATLNVYSKVETLKGLAAHRQEAIDTFTKSLDSCIQAEQLHPAYTGREPLKLDVRIRVEYVDNLLTQSNPVLEWEGPIDRMVDRQGDGDGLTFVGGLREARRLIELPGSWCAEGYGNEEGTIHSLRGAVIRASRRGPLLGPMLDATSRPGPRTQTGDLAILDEAIRKEVVS